MSVVRNVKVGICWLRSFTVLGTKAAFFSLINVGSGFAACVDFLFSFFFPFLSFPRQDFFACFHMSEACFRLCIHRIF